MGVCGEEVGGGLIEPILFAFRVIPHGFLR
jgi:hypothetical protein